MSFLLYPYSAASETAKSLALEIGCKRALIDSRKPVDQNTTLLNWGASNINRNHNHRLVINKPAAVANAIAKTRALTALAAHGVHTVEFTTDRRVALQWATAGSLVYARTTENGRNGDGITIWDVSGQRGRPPDTGNYVFYTKHCNYGHEYRVHIFNRTKLGLTEAQVNRFYIDPWQAQPIKQLGNYFFITQKKVHDGAENNLIRNVDNGWRFILGPELYPTETIYASLGQGLDVLDLEFGAFDVLINNPRTQYKVLEVNTAPGLENSTLAFYGNVFKNKIR